MSREINIYPDPQESKLEFLEYCKITNKLRFDGALRRIFIDPVLMAGTHQLHRSIVKLPWAAIITTNVDSLIEKAFDETGESCIVVDNEAKLASVGELDGTLLLKMHGTAGNDDVVLTFFEYQNFQLRRQAMQAIVISLFSQYAVLIIGAGLSDPNFQRLYGTVFTSLGTDTQPVYYVSPPLPQYVREVWQKMNFRFIDIPHEKFGDWLEALYSTSRSELETSSHKVMTSLNKRRALVALSSSGDYCLLQENYTSFIHMPDLMHFQQAWERTLYNPLRARMRTSLANLGADISFAYIGPGPHAPLFFGDQLTQRNLLQRIARLTLIDISNDVREAIPLLQQRKPTLNLEFCPSDITCGIGQRFTDKLMAAVRDAQDLDELLHKLENPDSTSDIIDFSDFDNRCLQNDLEMSSMSAQFDVVYSEMVATFVGTAPVMAAETLLRSKFRGAGALSENVSASLWRLWRKFNELMFVAHVQSLHRITKPAGKIIVAADVEKIFYSPRFGTVHNFPEGKIPSKFPGCEITLVNSDQAIVWRDHKYDFVTEVYGVPADYFRAHTHRVVFSVFVNECATTAA